MCLTQVRVHGREPQAAPCGSGYEGCARSRSDHSPLDVHLDISILPGHTSNGLRSLFTPVNVNQLGDQPFLKALGLHEHCRGDDGTTSELRALCLVAKVR